MLGEKYAATFDGSLFADESLFTLPFNPSSFSILFDPVNGKKLREEERIKENSDRESSRGPIHLLLHLRIRFVYREPFEASSVSR